LSYSKVDFGEALMLRLDSLLNQKLMRLQQSHLNLAKRFQLKAQVSVTLCGFVTTFSYKVLSLFRKSTGAKQKKPPEGGFLMQVKAARGLLQNDQNVCFTPTAKIFESASAPLTVVVDWLKPPYNVVRLDME